MAAADFGSAGRYDGSDDSGFEDEDYTCVDINGNEVELSAIDSYDICLQASVTLEGSVSHCTAAEIREELDFAEEHWHCVEDADSEAAQESHCTAADEWVLLDSWDGNVSVPVSRVPSISSTVASKWLSDVSSVANQSTLSNTSAPQLPKYAAKIATWAHPCDHWHGDSSLAALPKQNAGDAVPAHQSSHSCVTLLRALSSCELQLLELETGGQQSASPLLDLERGAACSKLCSELIALAAEALECGFSRNVPGAMEVFEQTNAAVERVASLLECGSGAGRELLGTHMSQDVVAASAAAAHLQLSQSPGCGCLAGLFAVLCMPQEQCEQ